jgi:hypothetical protein
MSKAKVPSKELLEIVQVFVEGLQASALQIQARNATSFTGTAS